jgi:F0F1-type ATP synthase epsilon subunit
MAVTGAGSTYGAAQQVTTPAQAAPRLRVRIFSPNQTYYEGEALSLTARNATGPFDVLPGHVNFFCLIDQCRIVLDAGYQKFEFPANRGVLKVTNDAATVFLDF